MSFFFGLLGAARRKRIKKGKKHQKNLSSNGFANISVTPRDFAFMGENDENDENDQNSAESRGKLITPPGTPSASQIAFA